MDRVPDAGSPQPRTGEVFGPLLEREGVTVLPVLRTGRSGRARVVGAWVVRDGGKAEWQPAFDLTRVIVSSNLVAVTALVVLAPVIARLGQRR